MKNGFNQLPFEIKLKIYELKGECFLTTPYRRPGDQFEFFAEFLGESKLFSPSRKTSWYQTGGVRTKVLLSKDTWKKELVLDGKKTNTKKRTWNQDDLRASWLFRWYDLHKRLQWRGRCAMALAFRPGNIGDLELYTIDKLVISFSTPNLFGVQLFCPFRKKPWVIERMKHHYEREEDYYFYKMYNHVNPLILESYEKMELFKLVNSRYFDIHDEFYCSSEYMHILKRESENQYIVKLNNIEFKLGRPNSHLYDLADNIYEPSGIVYFHRIVSDLKVKE